MKRLYLFPLFILFLVSFLSACASSDNRYRVKVKPSKLSASSVSGKQSRGAKVNATSSDSDDSSELSDLINEIKKTPESVNRVIRYANFSATKSPASASSTFENSIQKYKYVQGAVYQIHCRVGTITDIILGPKESLTNVSAGDTNNWMIDVQSVSGSGKDQRIHLLLKPLSEETPMTNMVITTDKRFYYLELLTSDKAVKGVAWKYPVTQDMEKNDEQARADWYKHFPLYYEQDYNLEEELLKYRNLNYGYHVISSYLLYSKIKIFDDGFRTYIQKPVRSDSILPLYLVSYLDENSWKEKQAEVQKEYLLNYHVLNGYIVIDKIIQLDRLRFGKEEEYLGATILNSEYYERTSK